MVSHTQERENKAYVCLANGKENIFIDNIEHVDFEEIYLYIYVCV